MHVNGETSFIGQKADPEVDEITVDGRPLTQEGQKRYLMLNKPRAMSARSLTKKGERPSPSSSKTAASASIPSVGSTSTPRDCCF